MLIQIWSATDIIFCHFRPFFVLLPHYWPRKLKKIVKKHLKILSYYTCTSLSRSHDVWVLRYLANSPKNETYHHFTKVYQKPWSSTILFQRYGVWFWAFSFYFHFGLYFYLSPPTPYSAKNKNFKRMKKVPADIIILHKCTKNHDHMIICYTVPDIWHVLDVIVIFHLGLFFALLPSDSPKHESFKKNEKAT